MKRREIRAFTLIEMLVVIGIIAVVGMLLFPALNKSRESARNTRCVANLRNLHMAALNRAGDNGHLPYAYSFWHQNDDGTWSHWRGWVAWHTWKDYPSDGPNASKPADGTYDWRGPNGIATVTNGSLYAFVKSRDVFLCPTHYHATKSKNAVRSYSMNTSLHGANLFNVQGVTTILFGDDRNVEASPYDGQFTTNEIAQWHEGQGNVIFVDGHVERR